MGQFGACPQLIPSNFCSVKLSLLASPYRMAYSWPPASLNLPEDEAIFDVKRKAERHWAIFHDQAVWIKACHSTIVALASPMF